MRAKKLFIPLLFGITAALIFAISRVENWGVASLVLLIGALFGTRKDAKPISWGQFMPLGLVVLFLFYVIYQYANPMWHRVVGFQTESVHHIFKWNEWFNSIPLNDASFMRVWQPRWLTVYFQWVYAFGFALTYWMCVIRAFFTKDVHKFARYSLAGYLLQVPLILIFYNTILLQEVWYVQGTPDLLERALTPEQQYATALNCFPSMHTSIAFSAILLAMREKSRWYRWVIGVFGVSIMISTLYLKIHWVIDMFAGMAFAYGCVKLSDWIVGSRGFSAFAGAFERLGTRLHARMHRGDEAVLPARPAEVQPHNPTMPS